MIIVGLGNPGTKYKHTRHNFGFLAVEYFWKKNKKLFSDWKTKADCLLSIGEIGGQSITLILPQNFMNNSGPALLSAIKKDKLDELVVIHDELDLPFGQMKLQVDKSAAAHNGVQSIIDALGTKNFSRLRLGIGHTPKPGDTEKFVLEKFTKEEQEQLPAILEKAVEQIKKL